MSVLLENRGHSLSGVNVMLHGQFTVQSVYVVFSRVPARTRVIARHLLRLQSGASAFDRTLWRADRERLAQGHGGGACSAGT